jgi:micrococcal nuclease
MSSIMRRLLNCICREDKHSSDANTIMFKQIDWEHTVSFIPPVTNGQVIKVYDGDTITIATKLPFEDSKLYRFAIRLRGIDAPEIKGSSSEEKQVALLARQALEELILHKQVTLKNISTEKYGRIIADVYIDDLHLNNWLLDNKYAVKYDGKTKKSPSSWLEYKNHM